MRQGGSLCFFLMVILSFSGLATAAPASAWKTSLGQSWPRLIDGLREKGIHSVGALDLNKFSQEAKKISWRVNPQSAPFIVTGGRPSAFYIIDQKKVFISDNIPADALASLADLELHEALGALGYDDRHYSLSSSLHLLLEADPATQNKLLDLYGASFFKKENLMNRRDDGGSSVGGGGDITTLLIKNLVLADILKTKNVGLDFLQAYPAIDFEPILSSEVDYIALNYKFRSQEAIANAGPLPGVLPQKNYQELLSVYVPLPLWEKGPEMRQRIIQDIKKKILTLLPGGQVWDWFADRDALYIKKVRESMISGKNEMSQYANESTAPSLPESAQPPLPGQIYFECTYTQGQGHYTYLVHAPFGRSQLQSTSIGLSDKTDDILMGMMRLEEDGHVSMMYTSYHGKINSRPVKDPKDLSISLKIPGQAAIRYSCERKW
jgi:hypothetical protein